ncbi:hypothetical protein CYY_004393 [Polysphondylium violaceum]|uniref:E2F-associated phosphoprotein n=1 Tax=Polysphondylium violaceum TaxID=133409 RepID=A0A8J4PX40_9MYCE|nr:hypothetical protein CYY_004393 [Polysphondylium violaceum]
MNKKDPIEEEIKRDDQDTNSSIDEQSDHEQEYDTDSDNIEDFNNHTQEERDALLFDDNEDEENEEWVKKNFSRSTNIHEQPSLSSSATKTNKTSKKDKKYEIYLSCPCCFTLLCIDCQKHDVYKNQYRAMFTKNCRVDFSNRLVYKDIEKPKRDKNNQQQQQHTEQEQGEEIVEYYHSVLCAICDTQVGVFDKDHVYHFFNVFPS